MSPRIRHVAHLQPDRVGGEDRPQVCTWPLALVDQLLDHKPGSVAWRYAKNAGVTLCHACPVRKACWTANDTEDWCRDVRGLPRLEEQRIEPDPRLGKRTQEIRALVAQGFTRAEVGKRLGLSPSTVSYWMSTDPRVRKGPKLRGTDLEFLVRSGNNAASAAMALNLTVKGIENWCRRNGRLDLWRALKPPKQAAVVSRRRSS